MIEIFFSARPVGSLCLGIGSRVSPAIFLIQLQGIPSLFGFSLGVPGQTVMTIACGAYGSDINSELNRTLRPLR